MCLTLEACRRHSESLITLKNQAFTLRPSRLKPASQDSAYAIKLRHHDCSFQGVTLPSEFLSGIFFMRTDAMTLFMIGLKQPDKDCIVAA